MKKKIVNLTTTEALVLQQIYEDVEDDLPTLSRQLRLSRHYAATVVASLKRKGLLVVTDHYHQLWIKLSTRGKYMVRYVWPQVQYYMAQA